MSNAEIVSDQQLFQCDILKDLHDWRYIHTKYELKRERSNYPYIIILTQQCDLTWDDDCRDKLLQKDKEVGYHDKLLLSCLVAPLYLYDNFIKGTHLEEYGLKMQKDWNSGTKLKLLNDNKLPRYHCLEFDENIPMNKHIVDFKHYFSVCIETLQEHKKTNFVCRLKPLYRDELLQRFANFLSRIALPAL